MMKDLSPDERILAELMSRISEESFSAGWMEGLEFDLWDILKGGDRNYRTHMITQSELDHLQSLSNKCKGWIIFDNENEETFVDIEVWQKMFDDKFNPA